MNELTQTEGKVLIELVRNQTGPDKEIAKKLGMAPSNLAVVKRRLEERGILTNRIRINIHSIPEFKVGNFVWMEFSKPVREKFEKELEEMERNFPHAFTFGSSDWSLNVSYYKSFTESEDARLRFSEMLYRSKLKDFVRSYMWKTVPISHMRICNFTKRLVRYTITHEVERPIPDDCRGGAVQKVKLTESEKKVLTGLRKYWNMKKSDVAKKLRIQRSSLSELFKSLLRKGAVTYTRTVERKMLPGRDMATFVWVELKQPFEEKEWERMVQTVVDKTPQMAEIHYTRTFLLAESYFHSLEKAENAHLMMLELFGDNVKNFSFKIVPCAHLQTLYPSYFLEQAFGISV